MCCSSRLYLSISQFCNLNYVCSVLFYMALLPFEKGKSSSSSSRAASSHLPLQIFHSDLSVTLSHSHFTIPTSFHLPFPLQTQCSGHSCTVLPHSGLILNLQLLPVAQLTLNAQTSEIELSSPALYSYSNQHGLVIPWARQVWLQLCNLGLVPMEAWKARFSFCSCAT